MGAITIPNQMIPRDVLRARAAKTKNVRSWNSEGRRGEAARIPALNSRATRKRAPPTELNEGGAHSGISFCTIGLPDMVVR